MQRPLLISPGSATAFIGPGLLKRDQPEMERLNLESKTHNLKRPVPVEVHRPVQRQFKDLLARDLRFDALSIRFETIFVNNILTITNNLIHRLGDFHEASKERCAERRRRVRSF
jgi:hypothetical protein